MQTIIRMCCLALVVSFAAGCREEGPAEKMGKDLDKGVEKLKDAVDPPGPAEKAGRKLDDAIN